METFKAADIGFLIKKYRKLSGLTQAELAEIINLNDKHLGKIERGIHYPSVPTFLNLIKILNIDINEFYINNKEKFSLNQKLVLEFLKNLSDEKAELALRIIKVL